MISYRSNYGSVRQISLRQVVETTSRDQRHKLSVEELGPYNDRANCRTALRKFVERVGRSRGDFQIVKVQNRFKIVDRSCP